MKQLTLVLILAIYGVITPRLEAQQIEWTDNERPLMEKIRTLRKLPDDERARITRELALAIRALNSAPNKLRLAAGLANLSTEGDFGRETLQEVATTLAAALREQPPTSRGNEPAGAYLTLAQLVKYEGVRATLDDPQYAAAMSRLAADDQRRRIADFTLTDLEGKQWHLKGLRGKVVLVNFWATWCPPCRKEMPDLQALFDRFREKGLVVLAISDEEPGKVRPFINDHHFSYPILLDEGRKASESFRVEGIPKSFVYDRDGKLVSQAIDMRTMNQFVEMLSKAGLR